MRRASVGRKIFRYERARERSGKEPLLPTLLFKNHTSSLRLVAQNIQWLLHRGNRRVLVSSLAAEQLAKRRPQKTLIIAGFVVTMAGIGLLLALEISGLSPFRG